MTATTDYSEAVRELMAMTDEVVPAKCIAPILHIHPSVMIYQAKNGEWDRNVCNYVVSGKRVKFFRVDFQIGEDAGGNAGAFAQNRQQQVFGADEVVIHAPRLGGGEDDDFLEPGRQDRVALGLGRAAGADGLFDFEPQGLEADPERLQCLDGDAFAERDDPEQKVLGADVVVVEAFRFLPCQVQRLARARREIAAEIFLVCHKFPPDDGLVRSSLRY